MRDTNIGRQLVIAAAVAVISTAAYLIVEFGPGNRAAREPIDKADRAATKAAAESAGAKVIPTQPKLAIEPSPWGPKPVQPPVVVY